MAFQEGVTRRVTGLSLKNIIGWNLTQNAWPVSLDDPFTVGIFHVGVINRIPTSGGSSGPKYVSVGGVWKSIVSIMTVVGGSWKTLGS